MDEYTLKKYFPGASKSTIAVNAGLAGLQPQIAKQDAGTALEPLPKRSGKGRAGLVVSGPDVRVTIILFSRKELDSDNLKAAYKELRDVIAKWLGRDDRDSEINWQYGNQITRGQTGTTVMVERI